MPHDSEGQKDARKALEVLWDAVIGSVHADVEETKKLTCEENVKRFFAILYRFHPRCRLHLDTLIGRNLRSQIVSFRLDK